MKKALKILLPILFLLLVVFMGLDFDKTVEPKTIDSTMSMDGKYSLHFIETKPAVLFGSQKVQIALKNGNKLIVKKDIALSNDGKSLNKDNWTVKWHENHVEVTMHGEEQVDEVFSLYFNGEEGS